MRGVFERVSRKTTHDLLTPSGLVPAGHPPGRGSPAAPSRSLTPTGLYGHGDRNPRRPRLPLARLGRRRRNRRDIARRLGEPPVPAQGHQRRARRAGVLHRGHPGRSARRLQPRRRRPRRRRRPEHELGAGPRRPAGPMVDRAAPRAHRRSAEDRAAFRRRGGRRPVPAVQGAGVAHADL